MWRTLVAGAPRGAATPQGQPPGPPARDPADPRLLALQAELLNELASSQARMERAS